MLSVFKCLFGFLGHKTLGHMKKYFLSLLGLFLYVGTANAQQFPMNDYGEIEFSETVETNLSSKELFANAQEWIARIFGDYKSVIQFEDSENGKLVLKGSTPIDFTSATVKVDGVTGMSTKERINYTLTIECKDGKYRYRLNDVFVIRTYDILGSIVHSKPISPLDNLSKIAEYDNELKSLQAIDVSKLKKKKLEEHNKKIEDAIKHKTEKEIFYNLEYETLNNLITSLKRAMSINNDF